MNTQKKVIQIQKCNRNIDRRQTRARTIEIQRMENKTAHTLGIKEESIEH